MQAGSGYGAWKYNPVQLRTKVELLKEAVPSLMQKHNLDGIVLHGSSGVWLGAALVLAGITEGYGLFLVRKPGEQSHGEIVEGDGDSECKRLLMIDDFVSSGESVRRVQTLIDDNKLRPATVVVVLQHERVWRGIAKEEPSSKNFSLEGDGDKFLVY